MVAPCEDRPRCVKYCVVLTCFVRAVDHESGRWSSLTISRPSRTSAPERIRRAKRIARWWAYQRRRIGSDCRRCRDTSPILMTVVSSATHSSPNFRRPPIGTIGRRGATGRKNWKRIDERRKPATRGAAPAGFGRGREASRRNVEADEKAMATARGGFRGGRTSLGAVDDFPAVPPEPGGGHTLQKRKTARQPAALVPTDQSLGRSSRVAI